MQICQNIYKSICLSKLVEKVYKTILEAACYAAAAGAIFGGIALFEHYEQKEIARKTRQTLPEKVYKAENKDYSLTVNVSKGTAELKTDDDTVSFDLERIVQD